MRRGEVPQKYIWEGKILNKISKKIISLVTMAAFVLTLVPAAAFGADLGASKVANVELAGENGQTIVKENDTATLNVTIGSANLDNGSAGNRVVLWAVDSENNKVDDSVIAMTPVDLSGTLTFNNQAGGYGPAWWLDSTTANDTGSITVEFEKAGTYTLYAGLYNGTESDKDEMTEVFTAGVDLGDVKVVNASDVVSVSKSQLLIDDDNATAEATQGKAITFEFNVLNNDKTNSEFKLNAGGGNVYVWVENSKGEVVKDAVFSQAKDGTLAVTDKGNGIWMVNAASQVKNETILDVTFPAAGDGYTINAAVATKAPTLGTNNVISLPAGSESVKDITVNVAAAEVVTNSIAVTSVTDAAQTSVNGNVYNFRINDEVTPSDTKVYTVTGTATTANGAAAENEKIYVSADKGMNLQGLAEDGTVTTNAKGEFTFKFTLTDAGQYEVTLRETNNDAKSTLIVTQGDVDAVKIAKVKDGGKVLAGTDKDYGAEVYTGNAMLSDAVQFAITDAYGRDAVGPGVLADEAAANRDSALSSGKHADSLEVKAQPQKDGKNTVDADDFYLAWDDEAGVYTLKYTGAAKDLVAGDYSVRVALNNGGKQAVTVNFTAVEFGTAQEIVLDTAAAPKAPWDNTANNNAITAIDDTVALGQYVVVTPKYVDENGLKVKINNYSKLQVGINGDAVADRHINSNWIGFVTPENIAANNSLVGTTVTVKVNDPSTGLYTEKELTVVKNYQAETLSVDPVQGAVGEANTVNVTVVDADGNLSKVNGKLTATLVSQSNEDANVDVKVNPDVRDGKASIYMESDAAGTADVRLVVEAANGELYGTTFTYTFGEKDAYAGNYVVMTIGSAEYVVNNKLVTGDAAPYVNSDSRTMVPFRVLGETFGATVDWDQDNKTVTYTYGDTTLTMTIGSTTYTVNGEDKTMDTAPVLSGDRTYVPVRFVAEALGYEVTPLYDTTNGTTASVVFQK